MNHRECVQIGQPATPKLSIRPLVAKGARGAKWNRVRVGRRSMAEAAVKHTVLKPMAVLRPFIKSFEVTQCLTERSHTLLPDTSLVACFRLNGMAIRHEEGILAAAFLSGLQDGACTLTRLTGSCVLLTVFTDAAAAAFLREPLDLLFRQTFIRREGAVFQDV